jgi:hypothetical protein
MYPSRSMKTFSSHARKVDRKASELIREAMELSGS